MFLGIEIGGTKLQLGIGAGDGSDLLVLERRTVDPHYGANGILEQIEAASLELIQKYQVSSIGIGFGGPVNAADGKVIKSHQIDGWDNFKLSQWCLRTFGIPAVVGNDCNVAALAEARFGAGRGKQTVFYVTVGTGIGGGLAIDGKLYGINRPAVAEIGHLRPGLHDDRPEATVESLASGWGIVAAAQARLTGQVSRPMETLRSMEGDHDRESVRQRLADAEQADEEYLSDLWQRCDNNIDLMTAKIVAQAAADGNEIAQKSIQQALQALGWAIAQTITLLAPEVIVIGGGVTLMGQQQFFAPLAKQVSRYVFPPLANSYQILPAALGEEAVVHGALALAAG